MEQKPAKNGQSRPEYTFLHKKGCFTHCGWQNMSSDSGFMFEVVAEHDLPFYFICRRAGRIQRVDLFLQAFFARLRRDAEQR
ncbi:hypothetical protein, partial [uncultured Desulfovibrio sp.]|uniref:hypothetical protein n=1 Tax=uncultured Desulfovibrio sp. TaxID=167968 RepID=UPI00272C75F0